MTEQSFTPLMKATSNGDSHSSQNHQKKGVTFDAMETLERISDCMDRLMSLVSDLKTSIDRKRPQYKPKIYQGRSQNQNTGQQNFTPRNRSFSRGRNQGGNRGNYNNRNNYRPNYRNKSRGREKIIGQVIGVVITQITIDKVMRDQTTDKTPNGLLEIEVRVGIEMRIIMLEVGVEIEITEEKSLGPDPTPG